MLHSTGCNIVVLVRIYSCMCVNMVGMQGTLQLKQRVRMLLQETVRGQREATAIASQTGTGTIMKLTRTFWTLTMISHFLYYYAIHHNKYKYTVCTLFHKLGFYVWCGAEYLHGKYLNEPLSKLVHATHDQPIAYLLTEKGS